MCSQRTRWAWALSGVLILGIQGNEVAGQDCPGTNPNSTQVATYTTTDDFNSQVPPNEQFENYWVDQPIRNNTIGVDGELRIGADSDPLTPTVFPYLWVACSNRGTVVRIATEDHHSPVHGNVTRGQILGEYLTAPEGAPKDPSRTTVDFDGSVWIGNRDDIEIDGEDMGHIVKIGTGLGHQWIDRNGNGVLDTSTELGDVRAWPNCNGGDFTAEDIAFAEDELILLYQPVPATGLRTVAVDRDNNVWIGGHDNKWHGLLEGQTGEALVELDPQPSHGGYGGLVDAAGVLWSVESESGATEKDLMRYDPETQALAYIKVPKAYGLAADLEGFIWVSRHYHHDSPNYACRIEGTGYSQFVTEGYMSRGVAVTWADNDIWVANSYSDTVTRFENGGMSSHQIALDPPIGQYPTGVAVDSAGMVWVTNHDSNDVMLIDPDAGDDGEVVDRIELNHPEQELPARPYNYSDMTGVSLLWTTAPAGVWTTVYDGTVPATPWCKLDWDADLGEGTLRVQVRAADNDFDLGKALYIDVEDNVPFTCEAMGRYLQIRVVLQADWEMLEADWPTLQALRVYACEMEDEECGGNDVADYCEPDCDQNGRVDSCDIQMGFVDGNDNGIPDTCEDCNGNDIVDWVDIEEEYSDDCQGNGVPDDCDVAPTVSFADPRIIESPSGQEPRGVIATGRTAADVEEDFDVDGDGDTDLIVVHEGNYSDDYGLRILWNDGDGNFCTSQMISLDDGEAKPYCGTAGDFDGDGDFDLAITRYDHTGKVTILLNNGQDPDPPYEWVFWTSAHVLVGDNPRSILTRDFDLDGDLDLAVANYSGDTVSVLYNTGSATFAVATTRDVCSPSTGEASGLAAGDVNGDGAPDLAVSGGSEDVVAILLKTGGSDSAMTFTDTEDDCYWGDDWGANARSVGLADLDRDGDLDALSVSSSDERVGVFENLGGSGAQWSGFAARDTYPACSWPRFLMTPDVNSDGFPDVVTTGYRYEPHVSILINSGDLDSFTTVDPIVLLGGSKQEHATAAHLDGNDMVDLVVVSWDDSETWVHLNLTIPPNSNDFDSPPDDIPDECQCPDPDPEWFVLTPPDGAVDARNPHPPNGTIPTYGIGMPDDPSTVLDESEMSPILIDIGFGVTGADENCFAICESANQGTPNSVADVVDHGDGTYSITLAHGIAIAHPRADGEGQGAVTTIFYRGSNDCVEYIHHPADADGSGLANANDIVVVVECLNHPGTCENYSADIDFSGAISANDILEEIDLLNGNGSYDEWSMTSGPVNSDECAGHCGRGEGGGDGSGEGGSLGQDQEDDDVAFGSWYAQYLMEVTFPDEEAMREFLIVAEGLTNWCVDHLTAAEKEELIAVLSDRETEFASPFVEEVVPRIVEALQQ